MNRSLTGLAAVLALGAGTAQAQDLTVNVVGNLGITTQSKTIERPFWEKEIGQASGGRIAANFKPWNEMGLKGPEVFRLLGDGVMNVATAQLGHHAGDAPINDATDLAGLSPTIEQFRKVTEAFRPALGKFYAEKLGLELLTMQSFQAQILYCREEFAGLKDLAGRKVRSSGASQADFIEYFGGTAVAMSFGEVQQGLQQGVIDCAITGTLGGYSAKWYEGAKFLYTLPINWGAGGDGGEQGLVGRSGRSGPQADPQPVGDRREQDVGVECKGKRDRHRVQHLRAVSAGRSRRNDPGRSWRRRRQASRRSDEKGGASGVQGTLRC